MTTLQTQGMAPNFNRDQGLLRLVAMVTMFIDHLGVVFFPGIPELRIIGRIAFPLFCWGIVQGFEFTRDWRRYALRLFVMALVAQPFYMLALRHTIREWNVLATLLLGLLSLVGMRKRWYLSHIWAPLICLAIAAMQSMDYGWRGVLLIQLMYLARRSRGGLAAMFVAFCLYWGAQSSQVTSFLGLPLRLGLNPPFSGIEGMLFSFLRLQGLAILALPFILINTRSGIRVNRWVNYLMYPGHLLLLWLAAQVL